MSEKPKVYFTKVVSPEKLIEVYEKLNIKLEGNIAVKIHSGEKGNKNFIKPEFIKYRISTISQCFFKFFI